MRNCELYSNSDNLGIHRGGDKKRMDGSIEQHTELCLILCFLVEVGAHVSRVPRLPDHVWSPNGGGDIWVVGIGYGLRAGPVGDNSEWGGRRHILLAGDSRSWACSGILSATRARRFLILGRTPLIIATLLSHPGPLAELRCRRGFPLRRSRPSGHWGRVTA